MGLALDALALVDAVWDMSDLFGYARDCLGDNDALSCYMMAGAVVMTVIPGEGAGDNAARAAAKDTRKVIVELGSGDFTNLPRIIADNPGAHVIGIEHPDVLEVIELAKKYPGTVANWDEIVQGYENALKAGAEVRFLDFSQEIPFKADQIISIAPNPCSASDVVSAIVSGIKPGGRVYVATVFGEPTGQWIRRGLSQVYGIPLKKVTGISKYPSGYMFQGNAEIIDFLAPW